MTDPREYAIQQALEAIKDGMSERKACLEFKISRGTIQGRRAGASTSRESHTFMQHLTTHQEDSLVSWILEQEKRGFAPSHTRVREMAEKIIQAGGRSVVIGKGWVPRFLARHPNVATLLGKPIDSNRIRGTQPELMKQFYDRFDSIRACYGIQQEDIWNVDEHGIALGVCVNSRVIGKAGKKRTYMQSPETREWVSIIETINATGKHIRPVVIFKGQNVQTSWFEEENLPDWLIATSGKGWTTNEIAMRWLREVFLPETIPSTVNCHGTPRRRMLILDGHGSHAQLDFLWECHQANVELLFLPAHSSHILQPLDLGTFAPLKSYYRKHIMELAQYDDAAPVKKRRFVNCYQQARGEIFNPRYLRVGWKAAGLFPWNPEKALNSSQVHHNPPTNDFLPESETPQTPKRLRTARSIPPPSHELFHTPTHPRDLHHTIKSLEAAGDITRDLRTVLNKTSKAFSLLTTQHAFIQASNQQLLQRLKELEDKRKKKKVPIDPNLQFVNIESIKRAMEEAAVQEARIQARKPEEEARQTSSALIALDMKQFMSEWQI